MNKRLLAWFCLLLIVSTSYAADVLIKNVVVYDGGGSKPFHADVRIQGNHIVAVAKRLDPTLGKPVRDEHGLALAPGFIDMHSHNDDGIFDDLNAEAVTRQGVTTVFVGQDGESNFPLATFFARLEKTPAAINFASMVGHATLREQVMGFVLRRQNNWPKCKSCSNANSRLAALVYRPDWNTKRGTSPPRKN